MNMYPEFISEENRAKIKAEMDAIRLEEEATQGDTLLDKNLARLGDLMISGGEKLRGLSHAARDGSSAKLINKAA
ncbi:MAG: hypothetical protein K8S20_08555 [Chloroflexi bacterium]|nr:hypothetical protein [Chloroflexota bacterium]